MVQRRRAYTLNRVQNLMFKSYLIINIVLLVLILVFVDADAAVPPITDNPIKTETFFKITCVAKPKPKCTGTNVPTTTNPVGV